jgi:hypothetical protein
MNKKLIDEPADSEADVGFGAPRPTRLRRAQKSKSSARSRKSRRKPANTPGGIHQRANKRIAW